MQGKTAKKQQFKVSNFYHEPHEQIRTKIRVTYRDGTDEKEKIFRYFLPSILFILSVLAFLLALSRS
jgi:hypothetical protein